MSLHGNADTRGLLGNFPEASFFSAPSLFGSGVSSQQSRFFSGQFPQIQNQFFGALGQDLRAGKIPSFDFSDFLSNQQQFNPSRFFQRFAPQDQQARFNPSTRFLFF